MGTVTVAGSPVLALTAHPLQRCGAWAVAVLAGRDRPDDLTTEDLDAVAARLVDDVTFAATRPGENPDWWKVLFALYPNAKPTHASRSRDPDTLRPLIAELFAPGRPDHRSWPCTFCSDPASVLWAKSHLPLYDSTKAVNTLPPNTAGWPVCRGCRVALWALPYGAWVTAGSATVVACANPGVERRFVARNVLRAGRIQQLGFAGVPADASAEAVTLAALRAYAADAPADAVLWSFKNDNQEPWLRVTVARQAVGRLLARIESEPPARRGWRRLRRALAVRDKKSHGYAAIARTLFDNEQVTADRLLRELHREFTDPPADPATVDNWLRLARAYQEEMYGMDVERLTPARDLIVAWITAVANPRGRFSEFTRASVSAYNLQSLLKEATARLYLDGKEPPIITGVSPVLLSPGQDGWRWRGQLFFEVVAELVATGTSVGRKADEDDDEDDETIRFEPDEEEEYA